MSCPNKNVRTILKLDWNLFIDLFCQSITSLHIAIFRLDILAGPLFSGLICQTILGFLCYLIVRKEPKEVGDVGHI